jgi:hypothetical protein
MILAVTATAVATIGVVIVSIAIASIIGRYLIKGLQVLLLRLLPPHPLSHDNNHDNEYCAGHNNTETTIDDMTGYPFDIRHCDPCDFLHNIVESPRRYRKDNSDNKSYKGYVKPYLPRSTPRSIPLPLQHIRNTVNRLGR